MKPAPETRLVFSRREAEDTCVDSTGGIAKTNGATEGRPAIAAQSITQLFQLVAKQ
jgi:hypothetical protein